MPKSALEILRSMVENVTPPARYETDRACYECPWCGALLNDLSDFRATAFHGQSCEYVKAIQFLNDEQINQLSEQGT